MTPLKFVALCILALALPAVVNGAPTISTQPVSQSTLNGTGAYFTVVASGTAPLSYQWKKSGTAISGATSSVFSLANVQATAAGSYTVTVTDATGSTTSSAATLTAVASAAATTPAFPTIPSRTFDVTSYGALGNGSKDNTAAIQSALDAAKNAGGGAVRIPAASQPYLCGPVTMGSNVNLQIDFGAILQALPYSSATPKPAGSYPLTGTSYANFINVSNAHDIVISGQGTIDGQGAPWWAAYSADDTLPHRPYLIKFTSCDKVLVTGVKLMNSPSFHLAVNASNFTAFGLTVSAPSTGLNTDGIDPAGSHILVQNCNVSVGDDNVVMKPGNLYCSDITIANCAFGTGHGMSIGGQSNAGLDGMVVKDCTFNGTTTGLRMKADPTQGGIVQNVTYSNLTMTNVPYPIVFYSYYNRLGTPGGVSGSSRITPAIVNSWNGDGTTATNSTNNPKTPNQPINPLDTSTLPAWKNIAINNLTATGATGYSIIWGLPLPGYYIANLTLNNVQISGGAGLEIYDAANVQITGTTSVGSYVTCNSLAITKQPISQSVNSGANVTMSVIAAGTSGLNSRAPTYQWNLNGAALANGTKADGAVISGATSSALTVTKAQAPEAGSYTVTVSNLLDAYDVTADSLTANSAPVSATSSAAALTVVTPFSTYISGYGLNPSGNGAVNADADSDGILNFAEFTLNGNPTKADMSILPTAAYQTISGQPALVYQFNRNKAAASSAVVLVEYSTDLSVWNAAVNNQAGVVIATTSVDANTDRVTATIPASGGRVFARLKITPY